MRISDWSSDVCSSDLVLLLRYSLRLNIVVSDREVAGNAQMPAHDIDELRIALRGPYGRQMTGRPDCKSAPPKTQAESAAARDSGSEDRTRTPPPSEKDMFGQGRVHRHRKNAPL